MFGSKKKIASLELLIKAKDAEIAALKKMVEELKAKPEPKKTTTPTTATPTASKQGRKPSTTTTTKK